MAATLRKIERDFYERLRKATGDEPFRVEQLDPDHEAWKGLVNSRGVPMTKDMLGDRVKLAAALGKLTHDGKASRWRTFSLLPDPESYGKAMEKARKNEDDGASAKLPVFGTQKAADKFAKALYVVAGGQSFKMATLDCEDKLFKSKTLKHRGRRLTAGMVEERIRALAKMSTVLMVSGVGKATTYTWTDKVPETYRKAMEKARIVGWGHMRLDVMSGEGKTTPADAAIPVVTSEVTDQSYVDGLLAELETTDEHKETLTRRIVARIKSDARAMVLSELVNMKGANKHLKFELLCRIFRELADEEAEAYRRWTEIDKKLG